MINIVVSEENVNKKLVFFFKNATIPPFQLGHIMKGKIYMFLSLFFKRYSTNQLNIFFISNKIVKTPFLDKNDYLLKKFQKVQQTLYPKRDLV